MALVNIKSFSSTTGAGVTTALEKAEKDDLDAIVFDMRNNGGGLLQGAAAVANLVLPPGKIVVFTVGKDGNPEAQMTLPEGIASSDPKLPDTTTPLYVLVNSNTASAAEVLAGCLQVRPRLAL